MRAIKAEREASQPLHVATGGSTFKNPGGKNPPGHKAWQLIDAAGCRGLRHGRAMVSDKHCNFLINTGGAIGGRARGAGRARARAGPRAQRRRARVGDPPHRPAGAGPLGRRLEAAA